MNGLARTVALALILSSGGASASLAHCAEPASVSSQNKTDYDEIGEVLTRYTRAADYLDSKAFLGLMAPEWTGEVFLNENGQPKLIIRMKDAAEFAYTLDVQAKAAKANGGEGRWVHHFTTDRLIDIEGDNATISAAFLVTVAQSNPMPNGGFTKDTITSRGTVTPAVTGYYDFKLRKISGSWKIFYWSVTGDVPLLNPTLRPDTWVAPGYDVR